jgi:hypothetical protein
MVFCCQKYSQVLKLEVGEDAFGDVVLLQL